MFFFWVVLLTVRLFPKFMLTYDPQCDYLEVELEGDWIVRVDPSGMGKSDLIRAREPDSSSSCPLGFQQRGSCVTLGAGPSCPQSARAARRRNDSHLVSWDSGETCSHVIT